MALQQNGRRLTAATTENSDEIFYTTPVSAFSHLLGLVPLSVPTFPKSFIRPQNREELFFRPFFFTCGRVLLWSKLSSQAPPIFRSWSLHLPMDSHLSIGSSFVNLCSHFCSTGQFFLPPQGCKEVIHLNLVHFFEVSGVPPLLHLRNLSWKLHCGFVPCLKYFDRPSLKERCVTRGADWRTRTPGFLKLWTWVNC